MTEIGKCPQIGESAGKSESGTEASYPGLCSKCGVALARLPRRGWQARCVLCEACFGAVKRPSEAGRWSGTAPANGGRPIRPPTEDIAIGRVVAKEKREHERKERAAARGKSIEANR